MATKPEFLVAIEEMLVALAFVPVTIPSLAEGCKILGVPLLLAPARPDKRGPKTPFPLVENARIQPAIHNRVPTGAPTGAGSY